MFLMFLDSFIRSAKSVKKAKSLPPKASSARVRRATPPSLPPRPPHNALLSPPTLFLEETLAAHFFFSKLQSIERKCVVEAMRAVPHTPLGSVIVCAGDAWEGFYVIDSGSVKVCIHSKESSSPAVERVLGPGEVFGEESLLYSTPSECTITVGSEETKLWWLSTAQYRHIMATAGANFLRQTFTTLRTVTLQLFALLSLSESTLCCPDAVVRCV